MLLNWPGDGLRFEAVSQLCEEWAVFGI